MFVRKLWKEIVEEVFVCETLFLEMIVKNDSSEDGASD